MQNYQEVDLKTKITYRDIAKISTGGNFKLSAQAEILQNYQDVDFKTKITDRNIAKVSRGGIFKNINTGRDIEKAPSVENLKT